MFNRTTRTAAPARPALRLEALEAREVPAVLIQIDYSRDTSGFFNNAEARATLERVASELGNSLTANLAAISPSGGNTWNATFFDPATGAQMSAGNLSIGANTIKLYAGARALPGSTAGFGGYGGFSISGTQSWLNTVQARGHGGFATWGGSITFDVEQNWHFGQTTAGLDSNELDFYSVAAHELGHVLGIGTAPQWKNLVQSGSFRGGNAMGVYGGAVPVSPNGDHWADGITLGGQSVSLDPSLTFGQRVGFTALDSAALADLGWNSVSAPASPPASTPAAPRSTSPVPPGVTLAPVVNTNGTITQYAIANGGITPTGRVFTPFPGYQGALHQAYADFNGDGVMDVAVATVGKGVGFVAVINGLDGSYIGGPRVSLGGVVGMVAFDVDGDGRAELITGEGTPMGIYVFKIGSGAIVPDANFAVQGAPGRAALATDEGDRTGFGDTVSQESPDAPAGTPAAYTVSSDPRDGKCGCGGCQSLADLGGEEGAEDAEDVLGDELLSSIRVA